MFEDSQQEIIFKYLVLAAALVCLVIFFKEIIVAQKILVLPEIPPISRDIKVDFECLTSQKLQDLPLFEELSLPEEMGRKNPFSPY